MVQCIQSVPVQTSAGLRSCRRTNRVKAQTQSDTPQREQLTVHFRMPGGHSASPYPSDAKRIASFVTIFSPRPTYTSTGQNGKNEWRHRPIYIQQDTATNR